MSRLMSRVVLTIGTLVCLAGSTLAQVTSTASETKTFEVIAVDGNQLVVNLPEGTREITVPDDFRFNIEGKQMSVRELIPGMKGTATITTTKTTLTPVTVTEVKSGQVVIASGGAIYVRTGGDVKMFTQGDVDKRGVKIMRGGKPAGVSDFRAGDTLTATIITSKPPQVVTEKEVQATLARTAESAAAPLAAAPAAAPPAAASSAAAPPAAASPAPAPAAAAAASEPPPAPAASAPAQTELPPLPTTPETFSTWPLVGLGIVLLVIVTLIARRRRVVR